jgi:RHS repeat-associated protein
MWGKQETNCQNCSVPCDKWLTHPRPDHGDWLWTERARTDLSGNACEKIASLPFGDNQTIISKCVDVSDVSRRHFTGKERDTESGLDEFGARYYSSSLGRFMGTPSTSTPQFRQSTLRMRYSRKTRKPHRGMNSKQRWER